MPLLRCFALLFSGSVYVAGCGGDRACETDLPEGWSCESSLTVEQRHCSAQAVDAAKVPNVRRSEGGRSIVVSDARFRCVQSVCAYLDGEPSTPRVLLQPCEMDPEAPAKCDCSSTLSIAMPEGSARVEVYARGDSKSGQDHAELLGSVDLSAEAKVLCDGSEKLRFYGADAGGNLSGVPRVVAEVGWSFLFIDGQCRYWSMVRPEGPIRSGTLSAQQELEFTAALELGRWSELPPPSSAGCPDASTTTFRFRDDKASVSCATTLLTESYGGWLTLLHEAGSDVRAEVRYSVTDADEDGWVAGSSSLAASWPLAQNPSAFLSTVEEQLAEPDRVAGADAEALRNVRSAYLGQKINGLGPWLRIPMQLATEDAGPRYFNLALRDVIAFERDGRLAPDEFFGP